MLLVIDVGNTNTVIGVYDDKDQLKENWRIRTVRDNTADEFNILARALFADKGLPLTALTRVSFHPWCRRPWAFWTDSAGATWA
jgi:type III pantothenate kinase